MAILYIPAAYNSIARGKVTGSALALLSFSYGKSSGVLLASLVCASGDEWQHKAF
jgi:hypothetical protein